MSKFKILVGAIIAIAVIMLVSIGASSIIQNSSNIKHIEETKSQLSILFQGTDNENNVTQDVSLPSTLNGVIMF